MGTLGPRGAAVVCSVPFRCPAALAHEAGLIETSLSQLASCFSCSFIPQACSNARGGAETRVAYSVYEHTKKGRKRKFTKRERV